MRAQCLASGLHVLLLVAGSKKDWFKERGKSECRKKREKNEFNGHQETKQKCHQGTEDQHGTSPAGEQKQ